MIPLGLVDTAAAALLAAGLRSPARTEIVFVAIMNGFCGMTLARFTSPAWLICCTTCGVSEEKKSHSAARQVSYQRILHRS